MIRSCAPSTADRGKNEGQTTGARDRVDVAAVHGIAMAGSRPMMHRDDRERSCESTASEGEQVLLALPIGDLRVVRVPLRALHSAVRGDELRGEHRVRERVGVERVDRFEQVAGQRGPRRSAPSSSRR